MITVTVVLLAAVSLLLMYYGVQIVSFLNTRKVLNKIPGPHSSYLIGNINDVFGEYNMFKGFRRLSSQYKICRLWFSYMGIVSITLPEDVESVISSTTNMDKGRSYDPLVPWLNTGLLTSSGHKWRVRRKLLTPTFHFNILQQFVHVFIRQTNVFLKELEPLSKENSINITPYITSFTLRTICETAMGIQFDIERDLESGYKNAIQKMGDIFVYRIARPWLYEDSVYRLTPLYWKQLYLTGILHKFSKTVINKRKRNVMCESDSSSQDIMKRTIMLDMLLLAMERANLLNLDGIREEVDTFIFEGHDTTSISVGFTLMLLANHSEIQEKVCEEAMKVLGPVTNTPKYQDLQNLSYLEMCIKESLRMYPSVPLIGRMSSNEFTTASGFTIPKNVQMLIHIYDLHRNPDIYPNPEKFDPNRFLPENTMNRHPFAYLPFSGGPRNCIGQKFAMLEMKTVISGILRKYILEPIDTPDTITLVQDFMLRSKNGIKLRLKPRATAPQQSTD